MDATLSAKVPQAALFYSTNRGWDWGAPDYVWPGAAARLLKEGVDVLAVLHPDARDRDAVRKLERLGARVFLQPPTTLSAGRLQHFRKQFGSLTGESAALRRTLARLGTTHVFVNQGGDFDIATEGFLHPFLRSSRATYDLIVRSTQLGRPLPEAGRQDLLQWFEGASHCYFNSRWTLETVRLKLLATLENAALLSLPIRFPHEEPRPWPADSTARLACVCRLDVYHKGLDLLLTALSGLTREPQPWHLNLYGRGTATDLAYLAELIRFLRLDDYVTIQPFVAEVRSIWDQNHCLVLTSRYEGFGVAMLEALACGRPVIRTPYGGAAEWIRDGENGFLCPAAEVDLIRETIASALSRFAEWETMGRAGHTLVRQTPRPAPEAPFLEPFGIGIGKPS